MTKVLIQHGGREHDDDDDPCKRIIYCCGEQGTGAARTERERGAEAVQTKGQTCQRQGQKSKRTPLRGVANRKSSTSAKKKEKEKL